MRGPRRDTGFRSVDSNCNGKLGLVVADGQNRSALVALGHGSGALQRDDNEVTPTKQQTAP